MTKKIIKTLFICMSLYIIIGNIFIKSNAQSFGKLTFKAEDENNNVIGNLMVSIYQLAIIDDNGNIYLNDDFDKFEIDISNLNNVDLDNLKKYALNNAHIFKSETTDKNGSFTISNLPLGIYFIIQNNNEEYIMQSTLVKIPEQSSNNILNYQVTVIPKIIKPQNLSNNSKGNQLVNDKFLPQTGIVEWPVPVLVIFAIILFSIGWIQVYNNKKKVE